MNQLAIDLFGQEQVHTPATYPWADGLVVDYFAGGGGASAGIKLALGVSPDVAINHNPIALAMHEANHPETLHLHDDVWHVDPVKLSRGRKTLLLWGSPDCRHFSRAKGAKPVRKEIRGLAWVLHRFAGAMWPAIVMLENVEEFLTWGPLVAARDPKTGRVLNLDGTIAGPGERLPRNDQQLQPDPGRKGETFRAFVRGLERHGYAVEWRVLCAADYGAPTSRRRLFLIARRDGLPIVWPKSTHGDPRLLAVQAGHLRPWRTVAECIDWSIPCPSIFGRKKDLADATLRRIARGVMRFVVQAGDGACLAPVAGRGGDGGQVAAFLAKHYGGVVGQPLDKPLGTITATDHHSLVAVHIQRDFGCSVGSAADAPLGSITAGSMGHAAMVASFLVKYYGAGGDARADEPLDTITSRERFGLVTLHGEEYAIVDIGFRMLQPHELFKAQGFPADYQHETVMIGGEPRTLTKAEQVAACGNSVPPPVVAALVKANVPEYAIRRQAKA